MAALGPVDDEEALAWPLFYASGSEVAFSGTTGREVLNPPSNRANGS